MKRLRDKIAMYKHRGHLECQVSRASAVVKWYKNKMEIKPNNKYEIKSEDVYRKLTINDVDSGDEDTYTCDATDDKTSCKLLVEGNTKTTKFNFTIKPIIISLVVELAHLGTSGT